MNISTTIEPAASASSRRRNWLKSGSVMGGVLIIWFGAMLSLMVTFDISGNALVLGAPYEILRNAGADVKIMRVDKASLVVTSEKRGYVKALYRAGAWLVLPSLQAGCLDLKIFRSSPQKAQVERTLVSG